jgi:septal ring factor EnvC (AmiA/AmiB activator)
MHLNACAAAAAAVAAAAYLQLSGGAELRRQLEVQLGEANAANSSLQAQLDRVNVNVETLTARMAELSSQLANSSEMGGSLRVQNSELMSELANLRCEHANAGVAACLLQPCIRPSACAQFQF